MRAPERNLMRELSSTLWRAGWPTFVASFVTVAAVLGAVQWWAGSQARALTFVVIVLALCAVQYALIRERDSEGRLRPLRFTTAHMLFVVLGTGAAGAAAIVAVRVIEVAAA